MTGLDPTALMRVRPPTAVARLAETPRGESACLGGRPPCRHSSDRLVDLMLPYMSAIDFVE